MQVLRRTQQRPRRQHRLRTPELPLPQMQEQLLEAQQKASLMQATASAGGGAVKVTASGDLRLTNITIDPEAIDPEDIEMLQDMILAAVNDALESAESQASAQMSAVTGGLNIPGLF